MIGLALLGPAACDDSGDDEGAAEEETGDPPDEETGDPPADGLTCETLDPYAIEAHCGPGGESLSGAEEDALVACVVAAVDDGRSFFVSDHYYANGGQFDTSRVYYVTADGEMWDHYSGFSDLCNVNETTLHGTVDLDALAACESWHCIDGLLRAVPDVETCDNQTNCDGV